jgi:hypothetical protein
MVAMAKGCRLAPGRRPCKALPTTRSVLTAPVAPAPARGGQDPAAASRNAFNNAKIKYKTGILKYRLHIVNTGFLIGRVIALRFKTVRRCI